MQRLVVIVAFGIHVRAPIQKQFGHRAMTGVSGSMQRRASIKIPGVNVSLVVQEKTSDGEIIAHRRLAERSYPGRIRGIHEVGAVLDHRFYLVNFLGLLGGGGGGSGTLWGVDAKGGKVLLA